MLLGALQPVQHWILGRSHYSVPVSCRGCPPLASSGPHTTLAAVLPGSGPRTARDSASDRGRPRRCASVLSAANCSLVSATAAVKLIHVCALCDSGSSRARRTCTLTGTPVSACVLLSRAACSSVMLTAIVFIISIASIILFPVTGTTALWDCSGNAAKVAALSSASTGRRARHGRNDQEWLLTSPSPSAIHFAASRI